MLDRVYRAVAGQRVDEIRYNIFYMFRPHGAIIRCDEDSCKLLHCSQYFVEGRTCKTKHFLTKFESC
jgi:hypothetical protein